MTNAGASYAPTPRAVVVLVGAIAFAGLPFAIVNAFALLLYLPYVGVGALLAIRRRRNIIGWLLIGIGWAFLGGFIEVPATADALEAGSASVPALLIVWWASWSWWAAVALCVVVIVVFPSGRLTASRWRIPSIVVIALAWLAVGVVAVGDTIDVNEVDGLDSITIPSPVAVLPHEWLPVGAVLLVGSLIGATGSMVVRLRRASVVERQQLRWLGVALVAFTLAEAYAIAITGIFGEAVPLFVLLPVPLAFAFVPVSIGIAVLRYRLYEIDTIINRAVLYGGVTIGILAIFGVANVGLQQVLETVTGQRSDLLTIALGVGAAVLYVPIRERVRPLVDRLLPSRALMTLLFTDIVGSTQHVVALGDERWRLLLGRYRAVVRQELARYGGHEVDTAGDAFFATFHRPSSGVTCAVALHSALAQIGLDVRIGLHLGECEMRGEKVSGIEVHAAARIMAAAADGEILLSEQMLDAISPGQFAILDRGHHELKGIPGDWKLYAVVPNG
jgi:class 3 adenylate cyclase